MIAAVDSSADKPTLADVQAAVRAGVKVWSGYISTKPNVNIWSPWTQANFDVARQCGGTPIAYCSGFDDPVALGKLAAQWGVRLCLDVEDGIRPDGDWVQTFLNESGAGLYGNITVHAKRVAAFHILAAYPGADPNATWPAGKIPPGPVCGWQWAGSETLYGCTVDLNWLDDSFVAPTPTNKPIPEGKLLSDANTLSFLIAQAQALAGQDPFDATHEAYATAMAEDIIAGKTNLQEVCNPMLEAHVHNYPLGVPAGTTAALSLEQGKVVASRTIAGTDIG